MTRAVSILLFAAVAWFVIQSNGGVGRTMDLLTLPHIITPGN